MLERELGSALAKELRKLGWVIFKLHNDAMQVGLPDYLMWKKEGAVYPVELKRAVSLEDAHKALTTGQRSVLESLAKTSSGAVLAWGCFTADEPPLPAYKAGVAVYFGSLNNAPTVSIEVVGSSKADIVRNFALAFDRVNYAETR